ncbi:protein of unknown function (plasmid) [Agrobacterium pusense]|uniref:Uncharacterized protein n=1 Tax=Agrobacterium pusense TaxID=648995 RepID=U4Q4Z2_9HYPH|nr:protein of unknown function [Agrobacterium pusense]
MHLALASSPLERIFRVLEHPTQGDIQPFLALFPIHTLLISLNGIQMLYELVLETGNARARCLSNYAIEEIRTVDPQVSPLSH